MLCCCLRVDSFNAAPDGQRQTPEEEAEAHSKHAVAVVPIATPLLAGPGDFDGDCVRTVASGRQDAGAGRSPGMLLLVIAVVALITWLTLRAAQRASVVLGITGMNVATRVGGLITAALAIEILASGLTGLFPG